MFATDPNRARLGCESLEARDNPAGNVTATLSDGWLIVNGDSNDNLISVQQNQAGDIIVYGYNGTLVNGLSAVYIGTFRLNGLLINMGDGNDYADAAGVLVNVNLGINGGNGNDTLALYSAGGNNDVWLDCRDGNDVASVNNAFAGRDLYLSGGFGFDTLDYNGATVGNSVVHWGFEQLV
jgi:hypothetical protein